MRPIALTLLALLLASALGPEAQANSQYWGCPLVIDDFTQGALPPANGPFDFTHVGLPTQSNVGGSRRVVIEDVPGHSAGMIPFGGNDIAFQMITEQNSGNTSVFEPDVLLDYVMSSPTDLTAGGANDRITLDIASLYFMSVFVYFDVPGGGAGKHYFPQTPGSLNIMFSEFSFVDFTQIERIRFMFHEQSLSGAGEMTISRIRALGSGSKYLYLQIPELIEIGPPFPLPGPLMTTRFLDDDGGWVTATSMFMALESALDLETGAQFPVQMQSVSPGRLGGTSAGFQMTEALGKADHTDGRFEFSVATDNTGGDLFPTYIDVMDPVVTDPDVAYIDFQEYLGDPAGMPAGFNNYRLRLQIPAGVAYDLKNVWVEPTSVLSFSVHFEIHDDGTAAKNPGQQLFGLALVADHVLENRSATSVPLGRSESLVLAAAPSLVSQRTHFRLSRGLDRAARIRVFDLAGRLVRTLDLPARAEVVGWDTRDDRGRSVASGVYVARLEAGSTRATRKLTVVR